MELWHLPLDGLVWLKLFEALHVDGNGGQIQ